MAPSFRYAGESPHNRLARTSMTLAVLAAFSTLSFPIVFPFILASVALVMAELSKGGSEILIPRGRVASRIAVIVIAVNFFLLVISAVYFIRVLHDPELQKQFADLLYRTYGITFEELMDQLGISYTAAP